MQQRDNSLGHRRGKFFISALDEAHRFVEFAAFHHAMELDGDGTLSMVVPAPVQTVERSLCVGGRFGDLAAGVEDQRPCIARLYVRKKRAALAGVAHRGVGSLLRLAEPARIQQSLYGEIDAGPL